MTEDTVNPHREQDTRTRKTEMRETRLTRCQKCEFYAGRCALHEGCCFNKWLTNPESQCPEGKW